MRDTRKHRHCGNEGICVSEHHECECRCPHCKDVKIERQRLMKHADRTIHQPHRTTTETCPPCLSFQDAVKASRRAKEARRDRKDRKDGRKATKAS